ncbi:hypothetical protein JB92DRAFT_1263967 [Gautieria morchelliformis]|nr:hypothetical protein JB92DRAFT_1263967 [Gautieria morchelliformis]
MPFILVAFTLALRRYYNLSYHRKAMPSIFCVYFLVLFSTGVNAQSNPVIHSLTLRQADMAACNATCAELTQVETNCTVPQCKCSFQFLHAQ